MLEDMMLSHTLDGRRLVRPLVAFVVAMVAAATARTEDYPLSLQLEVLERDLASSDYQAVLKTMIPTDLAAEWQRVATPDNYHLFARQHGGLEQISRDPNLRSAYERRKIIATDFLNLIQATYELKKVKVPFSDEAVLIRALESGAKAQTKSASEQAAIQFVLPCAGAEQ